MQILFFLISNIYNATFFRYLNQLHLYLRTHMPLINIQKLKTWTTLSYFPLSIIKWPPFHPSQPRNINSLDTLFKINPFHLLHIFTSKPTPSLFSFTSLHSLIFLLTQKLVKQTSSSVVRFISIYEQ